MKEEIKKMDQAVADSSSFIRKMKDKNPQQIAFEKTISTFGTHQMSRRNLLLQR